MRAILYPARANFGRKLGSKDKKKRKKKSWGHVMRQGMKYGAMGAAGYGLLKTAKAYNHVKHPVTQAVVALKSPSQDVTREAVKQYVSQKAAQGLGRGFLGGAAIGGAIGTHQALNQDKRKKRKLSLRYG